MNKSTLFSGQPVFSQLIESIPNGIIQSASRHHDADQYYKQFKSRDHLITMLYACFHNCTSLREVITGLEASYNKLCHIGLRYLPRRSTLADANAHRTVDFFEAVYRQLYNLHCGPFPDSRRSTSIDSRLFIMDSTTVSLFSDIMKGAGSYRIDGRKKGGVKAHVLLNAKEDVPKLIHLTAASRNDRVFMRKIRLDKGDYLVFDKGYHHFARWQKWTDKGIHWVTRLIGTEVYDILEEKVVSVQQQRKGVCQDYKILLGRPSNTPTEKITVRLISYFVPDQNKMYHFLTNNFKLKASTIAGIYQKRWQVETFFKRMKQTNPIKYFLGDNENAIRIQIWCSFIKDLLIKILKDQLKRQWSFSNLSSMIRHHLMNYLDLKKFLNDPDKIKQAFYNQTDSSPQLQLFVT